MAIKSCIQLALLVFASAAIFGVLVKAEICDETIGSCEGIVCSQVCVDRYPGSKGTCDTQNFCTCYFNCPKQGKCNYGLGFCDGSCDQPCCAQKCADRYSGGVGFCDDRLGHATQFCQCQFPCA